MNKTTNPASAAPVDLSPLDASVLFTPCDPAWLQFETTAEVPELDGAFCQTRAEDAISLGMAMARPGYNLFVLGPPGYGRHTLIRSLISRRAQSAAPPGDWCYVNNFDKANEPRVLALPTGRGVQLRDAMQHFVDDLPAVISAAFEGDEFRGEIESIQQEFSKREETALGELGDEAQKEGLALIRTPRGFAFVPMKDGEAMEPEVFNQLPEDDRKRIGERMEAFSERLHKLLGEFLRWRREMQKRMRDKGREILAVAVGHMVEEIRGPFSDLPKVQAFLDEVLEDVVQSGESLHQQPKTDEEEGASLETTTRLSLGRYLVNLLVDGSECEAAPVVSEDHPTYQNLIGRIDHVAHMGTLVTNFTLIKPGALHRANGGYLLLDAAKVLSQPFAWDGLKRALKSGKARIESPAQLVGMVGTVQLEPEPVQLSVKVVLIGERILYYLLREYDPEFGELFKIAADFEDSVDRDDCNGGLYVRLIATLARSQKLRPFAPSAVGRLVEEAARRSGDSDKLSAGTRWMADLLAEADHLAGEDGRDTVERDHIERALQAWVRRNDRMRDVMMDAALRGTLMIATDGEHVGQVNGLAAIDLGDFRFAHPVRITATARVGEGEVVDIERETELGGSLHSKGVMILSSFLAMRYSPDKPLSLAASLVFEQSYGMVEGDSASLAELCALLSVLAEAPIRQSFAMTGSVDQHGRVQAIGAVNEKIEGFFDLCKARGLTGQQGVLIPATNVRSLMLRDEVVQAVRDGKFRIHAVSTVDEAISLLTGVPAGEPDEQGEVPEGTINYRVAARIAAMSETRQAFVAEALAEKAAIGSRPGSGASTSGDDPDHSARGFQRR